MTFNEFKDNILILRDSINPSTQLSPKTVEFWYNEYFQYYSIDEMKAGMKYIIGKKQFKFFSIGDILNSFEEYYGYKLWLEVETAIDIMNRTKEKYTETTIPKDITTITKRLPNKKAWKIAYDIKWR